MDNLFKLPTFHITTTIEQVSSFFWHKNLDKFLCNVDCG